MLETYLHPPLRTLPALHGALHQPQIHLDQILNVHPTPHVLALVAVERLAEFLDLLEEDGEVHRVLVLQAAAGTVDVRGADDGGCEVVGVLLGGGEDHFVDVAVEFAVWAGGDGGDVVNVGPDFGVVLSYPAWVAPVGDEAGTAEVEEEGLLVCFVCISFPGLVT